MSYILDALKKSEEERNAARGGANDTPRESAVVIRHNWPAIGALLLLLNAILAVLLVWWNAAPTAETADTAIIETPATSPSNTANENATAATIRDPDADLAAQLRAKRESQALLPASTAPAPAVLPPLPPSDKVPFLRQLPLAYQQSLPELAVNIHVYSPQTEQSILYINNRNYRAGEFLQEGMRVEAIVPDGAVLSYRERYFKLPRPQ